MERRHLRHAADGALQLARRLVEGEGATDAFAESAAKQTRHHHGTTFLDPRTHLRMPSAATDSSIHTVQHLHA